MTAYNVIDPGKLVAGLPEDISVILANLQAIAATINGSLDNSNLVNGAAIAPSKIAGFPADASKALLGDGSWGSPSVGAGGAIPTGAVLPFAAAAAPSGYLLCDGSAVARGVYPSLFALLGVTYGSGDGSTTFNVPDMRGRAAVGLGTNADVAALGASDGVAVGSRRPKHNHTTGGFTLPDHWHNVYDPSHRHVIYDSQFMTNGGNRFINGQGTQGSGSQGDYGNAPAATTGIQVQSPQSFPAINGTVGLGGGPTDSEAYLVVNYIIKT